MLRFNGLDLDKMNKDDFDEVISTLTGCLSDALSLIEDDGHTIEYYRIKEEAEKVYVHKVVGGMVIKSERKSASS